MRDAHDMLTRWVQDRANRKGKSSLKTFSEREKVSHGENTSSIEILPSRHDLLHNYGKLLVVIVLSGFPAQQVHEAVV